VKLRSLMTELGMPAYYQSLPSDTQCFFVKKQFMKALAKQGGDPCSACVSYVCPYSACPGDGGMNPKPPGFESKCANCRPLFCPNKDCLSAITLSKFAPPMKRRPVYDALPKENAADLRLLKVACNTKLDFYKDSKAFLEDLQLMATMFMIPGTGDKPALCQRICKVAAGRIGGTTCEAIHQLDIPREKADKSSPKEMKLQPTPTNLKWICNQALPGFDDPNLYKGELMNLAQMLKVPVVPFNKKLMCSRIKMKIAGKVKKELWEEGVQYEQLRPHCTAFSKLKDLISHIDSSCISSDLHTHMNELSTRSSTAECPLCEGESLVFDGETSTQILFGSMLIDLRHRSDMCKLVTALYQSAKSVYDRQERDSKSTTLSPVAHSCMPTSKLTYIQQGVEEIWPAVAAETASKVPVSDTNSTAPEFVDAKFF